MSRGIALLFLGPSALDGMGGQPHAPAASTPGKDTLPTVQEAGPQGRFGLAENLVPTGIRSRTVQPVVSRYTD